MPLIEVLLFACLLAIAVGLWLRVDALQQQVVALQGRLTEHIRSDLGPASATVAPVAPHERTRLLTEPVQRLPPTLRLVKR